MCGWEGVGEGNLESIMTENDKLWRITNVGELGC